MLSALTWSAIFMGCHCLGASKTLRQLLADDGGDTAPSVYFSELLLGGRPPSTFVADFWERRPMHVQNNATHFDGLLTEADIFSLVAANPGFFASASRARFARRGEDNISAVAILNRDRLAANLALGHTAVIDSFEMLWPRALYLVNSIANTLKIETQANLYFTPANATPAFRVHFDTQDIFVVQLQGSKRWDIHEPTVKLPTALHTPDRWDDYEQSLRQRPKRKKSKSKKSKRRKKQSKPRSYTLSPGHVLFIPRGFAHDVVSASPHEPSIHLSISIKTAERSLWVHALTDLLDVYVLANPRMRDYPQFLAAIREAVDSFVRKAPPSLRSSRFPQHYDQVMTADGLGSPELMGRYNSLMDTFVAAAAYDSAHDSNAAALKETLSILQTAAPSLWHAVHERPKLFAVLFQQAWPAGLVAGATPTMTEHGTNLLDTPHSIEAEDGGEGTGECATTTTAPPLLVSKAPKVASLVLEAPLFAPFLKQEDRSQLEAGDHFVLLLSPTAVPTALNFSQGASPWRVEAGDVNYLLLPMALRESVQLALDADTKEPVGPEQLLGNTKTEATRLLRRLLRSGALTKPV
jgi:hypothetical protein